MTRRATLARIVPVAAALALLAPHLTGSAAGVEATTSTAGTTCSFFVSPTGSDTAAGSSAAPWKTLEKARDHIRTGNLNDNLTGDLTVCLLGGRHQRSQTFSLTDADSGSNGHAVIYAAASGATPIVDGGRKVTGWQQVAGKSYWQADVPTASGFASYFRQLYVGGTRAQLAMSAGITGTAFFRDTTVTNPGNPNDPNRVYDGIEIPVAKLKASYTDLTSVRLFHVGGGFKADYFPITKITTSGTTARVYLQQPYFQYRLNSTLTYSLAPGDTYHVLNSFEDLNREGEWYLDQVNHKVYYYPRAGEDMTTVDVYAPKVETLVDVAGTATAKAHDVRFDGITFEHGNWLAPKNAFIGGSQAEALFGLDPATAGGGYATEVPGQIKLTHTNDVSFTDNTVRYSGSGGLQLLNGAKNTKVIGNVFHNLTAAGIIAGRWKDSNVVSTERTAYALIRNNVVADTGDDFMQGTGISLMNTYAVTIIHNLVFDTAYSGIHQRTSTSTVRPGSDGIGRTTISYNWVHNGGDKKQWGMHDNGSIYSFGQWPGSLVDHNYVSAVTTGRPYMSDDNSYQISWDYNVATGGAYLLNRQVPATNGVTGTHNYTTPVQTDPALTGSYAGNWTWGDGPPTVVNLTTGTWPAEAQNIIDSAGLESGYAHLRWKVPSQNLAGYGTVTTGGSVWNSDQFGKLWDGTVETGEATTAANPAYLEFDFGRSHSGLTFSIQQDNAGTYRITSWKVQYLNASGTWTDVMPYQTVGTSAQVTYAAPATIPPTSKIRLYVQNANAAEYPAVQEFRVTGQPT